MWGSLGGPRPRGSCPGGEGQRKAHGEAVLPTCPPAAPRPAQTSAQPCHPPATPSPLSRCSMFAGCASWLSRCSMSGSLSRLQCQGAIVTRSARQRGLTAGAAVVPREGQQTGQQRRQPACPAQPGRRLACAAQQACGPALRPHTHTAVAQPRPPFSPAAQPRALYACASGGARQRAQPPTCSCARYSAAALAQGQAWSRCPAPPPPPAAPPAWVDGWEGGPTNQ